MFVGCLVICGFMVCCRLVIALGWLVMFVGGCGWYIWFVAYVVGSVIADLFVLTDFGLLVLLGLPVCDALGC